MMAVRWGHRLAEVRAVPFAQRRDGLTALVTEVGVIACPFFAADALEPIPATVEAWLRDQAG